MTDTPLSPQSSSLSPRLVEWQGETVDATALRLPDIVAPDLLVLFVGFNPSVYSALRGHYYARPGNRFWFLLERAGLTPRRYAPHEDRSLLDLGIGITDLCPIPTPGVEDVPRAVAESGRGALEAKIERWRPRIVCFNGRATYERFFGRAPSGWGLQPETIGSRPSHVFVVPSSSGRANAVGVAREAAFVALGELVRAEQSRPV
ncbi:MAG: G:T/U mismatch-specific uracil/thymine DNA-glycosylase [uncultured Thermomicrobiales bacterium]|uniref:G:T/U mismatch-specific uracil/thymine DNA-glycosylase n=1 Tax=uncultured Thermomicrobiales bacterium TaxID=1645740 RepID=A0A6J4V572_9BACT|nr:MAG: G:T/U mismatch-specific uracil/thymine DNA-glycosylase [uncultured Thermomicrobiales bacterium]